MVIFHSYVSLPEGIGIHIKTINQRYSSPWKLGTRKSTGLIDKDDKPMDGMR